MVEIMNHFPLSLATVNSYASNTFIHVYKEKWLSGVVCIVFTKSFHVCKLLPSLFLPS